MVKVELVASVGVVEVVHVLQNLQVGEGTLHTQPSELPKWMMS